MSAITTATESPTTPAPSPEVPPGYKRTEVGVIPEDWEVRTLQELCREIVDGTHFTPRYVQHGIPFYSVENVTADNFTDVKFISNAEHTWLIRRCKPERGDILLTRIGSLGETKLIDWDVNASIYVSLALLKLRESADPGYIYSYSKSAQFVRDVESRSLVNATPRKINMGDIGAIPVALPPSTGEQRAIAEALSDMDGKIAALDKLIAKKRAIKQATMQQLLTGKTRLPGFSEEWDVKQFGQLADIDPENLSSYTDPAYTFNYISLEQVDAGRLLGYTEEVFGTAPSRARRVLRYGDVLMSTVRPNLMAHLLYRGQVDNAVCSTGFAVLRAKRGIANPVFLFAHLFSDVVNKQIERILTGTSYPAINSRDVRLIEIPCPRDPDEQTAIATVLSDMDAEIDALERRWDKTKQVKQGMMQQLLTGRVRLVDRSKAEAMA